MEEVQTHVAIISPLPASVSTALSKLTRTKLVAWRRKMTLLSGTVQASN